MFRFAVLLNICAAAGEDEVSSLLSVRALKQARQPGYKPARPYEPQPSIQPYEPQPSIQPYEPQPYEPQPYEPQQPYEPLRPEPQPYEPPQPYVPVEPAVLAHLVVGSFVTDDTHPAGAAWVKRYEFSKRMSQPPVIVGLMSGSGPHPADIRFFDVDESGFTAGVVEPGSTHQGGDGPHKPETVHYIAAVPGVTTIDDLTIEAGKVETQKSVGSPLFANTNTPVTGGWENVRFTAGFSKKPAFLSGLQTTNNRLLSSDESPTAISPWLASATTGVKRSKAKVALERCEVMDGSRIDHAETIGWIALSRGNGRANGVRFSVKNQKTGEERFGWDDGASGVKFGRKMESAVAVASMSSRNGNNGGWLRSLGQTATQLDVVVDEDTFHDEERTHLSEEVSFAAFARPFAYP